MARYRLETIRDAARLGYWVRAKCKGCGRSAMFVAADMMLVNVKDRPLDKLRFRCKECDGRNHDIQAFDPETIQEKTYTLWRPVIYKRKKAFED